MYASVMPSAFVSVPIEGWLVSCYQESDNDNMSDWSLLVFVDFRPAAAECEQNRPCGLDKDLSEAQFEWSRQNLGACSLNIFSYKGDHYLELFGFKWPYFRHLFIIFLQRIFLEFYLVQFHQRNGGAGIYMCLINLSHGCFCIHKDCNQHKYAPPFPLILTRVYFFPNDLFRMHIKYIFYSFQMHLSTTHFCTATWSLHQAMYWDTINRA